MHGEGNTYKVCSLHHVVLLSQFFLLLLLLFYLTIRLRARDFYEVIVDEGEARINYPLVEIESEHENSLILLLAIYRGIDSEQSSQLQHLQ